MTRQRLTKAQVQPYMAHWRAARAAEIKELRAATPEHRLRQMAALMFSADALGWATAPEAEVAATRARWARLRSVYAPRG